MRRRTIFASGLAAAALLVAAGMSTGNASAAVSANPFGSAVGLLRANAASAHFGAGQTFTLKGVLTDADGTQHVRMHRYYYGLPVLGGDLVAHLGKGNSWRGASQSLGADLTLSRQPGISGSAASAVAVATSTAANRSANGAQLVVDAGDGAAVLAYEMVVGGVQPTAPPASCTSSSTPTTGQVRDSWEAVQTDAGTGRTFHSGTVGVDVTLSGSTY